LRRSQPDSTPATTAISVSSHLLHELRSPLTEIIGYSEMLAEEGETQLWANVIADVEKVGAAGRRLLALLEENFTSDNETASPIPRRADEAPAPVVFTPAGQHRQVEPGSLLVVDDDATNREVLTRRLERQGHVVTTAARGIEALALLRPSTFDLVLLDIMMPDMDGYELLQRIKTDQALQHIPVIMISALNEVQSVVRCIEAGADDYLTKPFNPILLRARIGSCLEHKRGRDRESILFAQLEENYKRLQELERLRDDMRNMIVHDLRTPLTSVIAGMDMIGFHGQLNEAQHEMVAIAAAGGKTLLRMINDLLDVEKMESGSTQLQYADLSAAALAAAAIQQVASLAEDAGTTLVTEVEPEVPSFAGDENMLSRTLVNLIANAIKFTRAGVVTISACRTDPDAVCFSVRDTGQGIPAEAFERIFDKFGQVDSRDNVGTGLGLAFCKLAVEAHGGTISVASTPGTGSTFAFTIPLVRAQG